MTTHGRPSFAPLFLEPFDLPNPDVRDVARGKAGVYILRQRGIVRYVGSSVPEEKGGAREPLRLWKTVLRHFQKCKGAASGRYGFGDDNFCTHDRNEWEIAIFDTAASDARKIEQDLIEHYQPTDQPKHTSDKRKARKPKNAGGRRKRNPHVVVDQPRARAKRRRNPSPKKYRAFPISGHGWEYAAKLAKKKGELPQALSHICEATADDFPIRVLCKRVKFGHILEDASEAAPPETATCEACLSAWRKLAPSSKQNPRAELAGDTGTIDDEQKILHHASVAKNVPGYLFDVRTMRELAQRGLLTERPPFSDFSVFVITKEGREAFAKGTR